MPEDRQQDQLSVPAKDVTAEPIWMAIRQQSPCQLQTEVSAGGRRRHKATTLASQTGVRSKTGTNRDRALNGGYGPFQAQPRIRNSIRRPARMVCTTKKAYSSIGTQPKVTPVTSAGS